MYTPVAPSDAPRQHHEPRASHRPSSPAPDTAAASSTSPLPTYLCTFCWRPHHSAVTPSRVVGHRARLACQPYYGALLDLAVCWVCGEVVFRGDECVSLGWCFWHRACYGCLMCGDRRVVQGATVEQVFGRSGEGAVGRGGEEVEEVPLCARCVEETGCDRVDEDHLIPMALGRVDRFDGGLSRRRWESRQQQQQQQQPSAVSGSDCHLHCGLEANPRTPSPIYVSIRDPFGEPAFRRSQTKPIPKWMQYLPNQKQAAMDCPETRPASMLNSYFTPPGLSPICSDTETEGSPQPAPSTYTPVQMSRPFTLITEEPVQRPSSTRAINKHVRFTTSTSVPPPDGTLDDRYNAPSESSEFLDKYQVQAAIGGSSTKFSARPMPSHLDNHHARRVSPFFQHEDTKEATALSEGTFQAMNREGEDEPFAQVDSRQPYHARSALDLVSGCSIASGRRDGEKNQVGHHQCASSLMSNLNGCGDGAVEDVGISSSVCAKRRPPTFQDQLKRVFGLS